MRPVSVALSHPAGRVLFQTVLHFDSGESRYLEHLLLVVSVAFSLI